MKAGIHPQLHEITIIMSDKTTYKTRSTWGKPGDVMTLDIDPLIHQAWVGGTTLRQTGQVEKFNNRYAFLNASADTKNDNAADKKDDKKTA